MATYIVKILILILQNYNIFNINLYETISEIFINY